MDKATVKRIIADLAPYKKHLAGALLSCIIGVPLGLLGPVLIGEAIDEIIAPGNVNFKSIAFYLLLLALSTAGASLLTWLTGVFTRKLSANVGRDMRMAAFSRISRVPLKEIDTRSHGDLVSRLVNDSDALSEGLLQCLTQLFPGLITVISTIIIMLTLNPLIALLVIFVTPLSIFYARFIGRRTNSMFKRQAKAQGAISGYVGEMVGNQDLVQLMGYEETSNKEFAEFNNEYYDSNFKATFYSSVINPGTRLINAIVYGAVAAFGALYAVSGHISVGGLSAFLSYANQYTKPFNEITAVLAQLQNAVTGAERIYEIIDLEEEAADSPDALSPHSSSGNVSLENVFFSYSKNQKLIQDFNLKAQRGKRIAFVGPTGCGKTTVISLLMRFYEVDRGNIYVDGNEIRGIKRDSLRNVYGMVLQETWLKNASVRDNIAYANPGASQEEVEQAAKSAYAHRFILRLPQGYNTIIESGGSNLSEGQKQLLCIARIMLSKPDILILDEATSSIDTRTEMLIQKALEKLMEHHTSFIVAHRLSTIQNADIIVVMESGKIVEKGRHDELLMKKGFYSKLYESQFAVE